jgi:hypothetical protein
MSFSTKLKNKLGKISSHSKLTQEEYTTQYDSDDEEMFKAVRGLLDTCSRLSKNEQEIDKDDIVHIKYLIDNFTRQRKKTENRYNGDSISKFVHDIEDLKEYIDHNYTKETQV